MESVKELDSTQFQATRPPLGITSTSDSRQTGMEELWLEYKAAIWGLGSVATSSLGIVHLEKQGIINILVNVAENCQIISLKGTAFYALGLVAATREGALALGSRGWASVRHSRSEIWPIAYEWWECADDCLLEQQEEAISSDNAIPVADDNLDESWILEDKPTILVEDSIVTNSRDGSTKKMRRKKTTSECTEDSIASQSKIEIDFSSAESPAYPISGKFTDKITNWFSGSSNGTNATKSEPRNSGSSRRFSDSGRLGSSIAKIRNSFRRRSKTLSSGCTPPREGTPVSSTGGEVSGTKTDGEEAGYAGGGGDTLKLSFSQEEGSSSGGGGGGVGIPASPDTMPGEIFSMEKILEEPNSQSTPLQKGDHDYKKSLQYSVRRRTESEGPGLDLESPESSRTNIQLDTSRSSQTGGKEMSGAPSDQMDVSITSITSIPESGLKVMHV